MSAQTFGLHLAEARDHGRPLLLGWMARHGSEHPRTVPFVLWPTGKLDKLTVDDLLWCLIAAALDERSTHLELRFRPPPSFLPPPEEDMDALLRELEELGFDSMDREGDYVGDSSGEIYLRFALFSTEEYQRVIERV